jgi:hypothetical protein
MNAAAISILFAASIGAESVGRPPRRTSIETSPSHRGGLQLQSERGYHVRGPADRRNILLVGLASECV